MLSEGNHMDWIARAVRWLVVIAVPTAGFLALLAVPTPVDGFRGASLEAALLTLGRGAGLALTLWLILGQVAYTAAVLTHTDRLAAVLRPLTLPIARRVAAGLASAALTFGGLSAPALAQPTSTIVEAEDAGRGLRQNATPTPNLQPLVEPRVSVAVIEPTGSYSRPLTWLVRPGDHLWSIAGDHLTIVLDRPPTPEEHGRYWTHLIDAARPVIRSGDPDLIYPGEEIPLPPTLDAGIRP